MREKELQWRSDDGLPLFARQWEPEAVTKGAICLVHGLGEHSDRYRHWAGRLAEAGYAAVAIDLRGHGRSGGKRGDVPSFDHLADDINLMLDHAEIEFKETPRFLYGHSMGGMLVLFYLIQRCPSLTGAIITSPFLHSVLNLRKDRIAMTKLLSRIMPGLSVSNNLEVDAIAQDQAVIEAYRRDPLIHDRVTVRMGKGFIDTIEYIFNRAGEITVPLLIMHGTADRITYPSGSKKITARVSGECTLKLWEGVYHELHNEKEKDKVFAYLDKWLGGKSGHDRH